MTEWIRKLESETVFFVEQETEYMIAINATRLENK